MKFINRKFPGVILIGLIVIGVYQCRHAVKRATVPNEPISVELSLERLTVDDEGEFYMSWLENGIVKATYNLSAGYDITVMRKNIDKPKVFRKGVIVHRPWLSEEEEFKLEDQYYEVTLPMDFEIKYVAD